MQDKKVFLAAFLTSCFAVKVAAEAVHEACGQGILVLFLGGRIRGLYLSFLHLTIFLISHIDWHIPAVVGSTQMGWIYGGGILACLCLSLFVQAFLLFGKRSVHPAAILFFWLGFLGFVNSMGYLVIGGFHRLEMFTS